MISNNKGFSLIELMVVVAIIAILSTIAIPSYQNFQAKARQKEGLALLSGYYTAAQATRAEHGLFPGNFVQTGFAPTGQTHFRLSAADGTDIPITGASNDNACIDTSAACNCGGSCGTFKTWVEAPAVATGIGAAAPVMGGCGAIATTNTAFLTTASGIIQSGGAAADADTWSMNQLKALVLCNDGIN